jgi:porin
MYIKIILVWTGFVLTQATFAATTNNDPTGNTPASDASAMAPAAQSPAASTPGTAASALAGVTPASEPKAPAPETIWSRATLFGDMGGLRTWMDAYGVSLAATETSEVLANVRGGLRRGATYDGLTTLTLSVDTQKALGWAGGTFNVSGLQIHGRSLSQYNLGTLNTASGIEAPDSTRLWELWYQQALFNKRVDIKVGQQSIDQEFLVSQYGATFIGAMFGWPGVPSYDMPSGGPSYPLAALGVRVHAQLTPSLSALAGVFDGAPQGHDLNNHSGTTFNLHDSALYIGELQWSINQAADASANSTASSPGTGLPGTYKVGAWYNTGRFDSQRNDTQGVPLANPLSNGVAATYRGDYSFYAVADQMVWRSSTNDARNVGVFARIAVAPGNRNLVSVSANLGVVMKAPFASRPNDSVGLGLAYIKIGNGAHNLDLDYRGYLQSPYGVRTSETALEATYQYQVTPWWLVQGDVQYTFNAGAGQNPVDATRPLRNTAVIGVLTTITF